MDAPRVAAGICKIKLLDIKKFKHCFRTLCYLERLYLAWNNASLEKMLLTMTLSNSIIAIGTL
jgi:hypothetical protein